MRTQLELNTILVEAVKAQRLENIAAVLLEEVDCSFNNSYAFQWACCHGFMKIVYLLLNHPSVNPAANKHYGFRKACAHNHIEVVQLLLENVHINSASAKNRAFTQACANGHEKMVRMLLADARINPSNPHNEPLQYAIINGHTKIVEILLTIPSVMKALHKHKARFFNAVFYKLLKNNNLYMAKYLLSSPSFAFYKNIFSTQNLALACRKGFVDIVEIILKNTSAIVELDKKYDVLSPLSEAALHGHLKVVELLLCDKRIRPFMHHYESLCQGAKGGHLPVVKFLAEVQNTPEIYLNYALNYSAMYGQKEVLKYLLYTKKVDPSFYNFQAVKLATAHNQKETFQILMKHFRVNPTFAAWGASALSNSFFNKNNGMAKMMLLNEQISKDEPLIRPQLNAANRIAFNNLFNEMEKDGLVLFYLFFLNEPLVKDIMLLIIQFHTLIILKPKIAPTDFRWAQKNPVFLPDGHGVIKESVPFSSNSRLSIYHPVNGLVTEKTFEHVNLIPTSFNGSFLIFKSNHKNIKFHYDSYLYNSSIEIQENPKFNIHPEFSLELPYNAFMLAVDHRNSITFEVIHSQSENRDKNVLIGVDKVNLHKDMKSLSMLPNGYLWISYEHRKKYSKSYKIFQFEEDAHYLQSMRVLGTYHDSNKPEESPRDGLCYS